MADTTPTPHMLARDALAHQPVVDMHTHLFAPAFGHSRGENPDGRLLWGIDELLSYHYFIDEFFRLGAADDLTPERFYEMPKRDRADLVWRGLFVERTPVSEACIGLMEVLTALGLDPNARDLAAYRTWFAEQDADAHVDRVLELAGVERVVMTNEVFDPGERALWLERPESLRDSRFAAVVRMDALLTNTDAALAELAEMGYATRPDGSGDTESEVRRFLSDWIERTNAVYLACSLPPEFAYPDEHNPLATRLMDRCIIPAAQDAGIPLAIMIGVRRRVNPAMREAGDGLGRAGTVSLCNLAAAHPHLRLLVTLLSREDQHELCIAARKLRNITPFGCWWYVNTTSMIEEITRERLELLGTSFVPQHSDARVLEQLIYKWNHARRIIGSCVGERYEQLAHVGGHVNAQQAGRDAGLLLRQNFVSLIPSERW